MHLRSTICNTWGQADEGAVGESVAAVGFEVDGDGAEDGLQVFLLFQTAGGLWGSRSW